MITGIYKITNLVNGKIYIGQSLDIERRYKAHINFSKNKSSREYNTPIHNAIRKYGEENFKYEILIECKKNAAIWLLENGYSKATIESIANRLSTVKNKNIKAYGFLWKTKEGD